MKILGLFALLILGFTHADEAPTPTGPWLTGPLIAPVAQVIPKGHAEIEYYLYVTTNTGIYDKHWQAQSQPNLCSVNPQIVCIFGLTEWMDIQITPQSLYNFSQGKSSVHLGDTPIGFDFQLYPADDKRSWVPGVKFTILETFPTGKYQKLNPDKKSTDLSGTGSFRTGGGVVFYKVFHLKDLHYLSAQLSLSGTLPAPVHVKEFNNYGGGFHTSGKVRPGISSTAIFSFEYTFTQNWVFALDSVYVHTNKNRFSGKPGVTSTGDVAQVGNPSSEQVSFAPALEYNFSANFGIIAGAWVTAWGRNVTQFRSGVINFDVNY
jgi:hypothetical protein